MTEQTQLERNERQIAPIGGLIAQVAGPILIMCLVGSLLFFFIEVFYHGGYNTRVLWIFGLFVFAAVLVSRISIELGKERAYLYGLALGAAIFFVTSALFKFEGPFASLSPLINLTLICLVWWSAAKLTWDCTLVDDSRDTSAQGLIELVRRKARFEDNGDLDDTAQQSATESTGQQPEISNPLKWLFKKSKNSPGLWVLYFSAAALPIFGFGQAFIPVANSGSRQFAFMMFVVYMMSALGLLMTTSLLSLSRYVMSKRTVMPMPVFGNWLLVGSVFVVIILVASWLIPRPAPEHSIAQSLISWTTPDRDPSRFAIGNDGKKTSDDVPANSTEKNENAKKSSSDGNSKAGKPGRKNGGPKSGGEGKSGKQNGSNDNKKSQNNGQKSGNKNSLNQQQGDQNKSNKRQGNNSSGDKKNEGQRSDTKSQQDNGSKGDDSKGNDSKSGDAKNNQDQNNKKQGESDSQNKSQQDKGKQDGDKSNKKSSSSSQNDGNKRENNRSENNKDRNDRQENRSGGSASSSSNSNRQAQSSSSRSSSRSQSSRPSSSGTNVIAQAFSMMKYIMIGVILLVLAVIAFMYRKEIVAALKAFWQQLLDMFAGKSKHTEEDVPMAIENANVQRRRPFSEFTNPFNSGAAQKWQPDKLVNYTFWALEAWARDRELPRSDDQTAIQFGEMIASQYQQAEEPIDKSIQLYCRINYAGQNAHQDDLPHLERLWKFLSSAPPHQPAAMPAVHQFS